MKSPSNSAKLIRSLIWSIIILSLPAASDLGAAEINFCGTIGSNTTWTAGNTYTITCNSFVQGSSAPVLTINDTVQVKFNTNVSLVVGLSYPGGIKIMGTGGPNTGVQFKSSATTPGPGNWAGLRLDYQTTATSEINFVTIKHATNGLTLTNTSPKINHATIQENSGFGIVFNGTGNPNIYQASFSTNGQGAVSNSNPSNTIKVLYSWWNSASGPSCSGCPGSGQSVSTGVSYEPWLTAVPSDTNYFETFSILNRTFNPLIGAKVTINFTTSKSGNWTATILNSSGVEVTHFNGSGSSGSPQWNGSGITQSGTYTYKLEATSNQGKVATPATGYTYIDVTKVLSVTNFNATPLYFSPNNDGVQETTTMSATINYDDAAWTLNIKNSPTQSPPYVKTATGTAPPMSFVWNGKNTAGVNQLDGTYYLDLIVTEGTSSVTQNSTTVIDKTVPTSNITLPAAGDTVSNVKQNGSSDVNITGTANDANMSDFTLKYGIGSELPTHDIPDVGVPVINGTLGIWPTEPIDNAPTIVLELKVYDYAGNFSTKTRTIALKNYKVVQDKLEFNGFAGQTVTYTSTIPFLPFTETIKIYKEPSKTTLIKTLRNAYSYSSTTSIPVSWDGTKTVGGIASDGPYFMFADVSSGGFSMTWDRSNKAVSESVLEQDADDFVFSSFEPYRNQPLTYTYNFPQAGRIRIIYAIRIEPVCVPGDECCHAYDNCVNPPDEQECVVENRYEESGPHTIRWAGVDNEGRYRDDFKCVSVTSRQNTPPDYPMGTFGGFAQNAVVLFGTKPAVTNLTVVPPLYGPYTGNQQVNFTLSKVADIEITFLNQECAATIASTTCILRTITSSGAVGANNVLWDGKANNGAWVAPGPYLVTVKASDAHGNVVTEQILTTVRY